jgi:hypothetical protein
MGTFILLASVLSNRANFKVTRGTTASDTWRRCGTHSPEKQVSPAVALNVGAQKMSTVGNAGSPERQSLRYTARPRSPVHSE